MSRIKKQHYVPRFYLRGFSENGKSVYVFDKPLEKVFEANISDIACESAFYDVQTADIEVGIDQFVEKYMQPFEELASRAIYKLLESLHAEKFCRIHPDIRRDLSIYLALQWLRTKESRETFIEMFVKTKKEEFFQYIRQKEPGIPISRKDFDLYLEEDKKSAYHSVMILDDELRIELAAILYGHYWYVLENQTGEPFYTSDQPLVKRGHFKHPIRSMQGFASLGIEIAFPLSPKYLLIMCDKTAFPQAKRLNGKLKRMADSENLIYYNHLQVIHSYRQVYSLAPQFDLAKQMIAEEPHLKDTDYDRIQVDHYEFRDFDVAE